MRACDGGQTHSFRTLGMYQAGRAAGGCSRDGGRTLPSGRAVTMLTALDVARSAGLKIQSKGARGWACCPLHEEKSASLCFFPDGKFYCFSCHAHGDAADLYAALYHTTLAEALRMVRGGDWKPVPPSAGTELKKRVETWRLDRWREACRVKYSAQACIDRAEAMFPAEILMQLDDFYDLVKARAEAEEQLDLLESATPAQLLQMMGGNP